MEESARKECELHVNGGARAIDDSWKSVGWQVRDRVAGLVDWYGPEWKDIMYADEHKLFVRGGARAVTGW